MPAVASAVDPLAGLKAAMAGSYADPEAEVRSLFTPAANGYVAGLDPEQDRLRAKSLASTEALQATDPDYALSRQRDEILNERGASNEADAQFGDQMAARALKRAIASKLGLANAEDEAQLTQAHEQVVRNAGDEAMRREAPKIQSTLDVQDLKNRALANKADADKALAEGRLSQAEYTAYVNAQAKVLGSPFAAQATNIAPPPAPVAIPGGPTGALNAAVATRTGGAGGQTYSPTQEALIARMLNSPGGRGKTRADAIAVLDRTKPQGWQ